MSGLYSPINRAAESITRPKGTGAEYMAELQKKPGYKPAEAEDRDLQTLMALPQMERAAFMEKLKAQANKFPLKVREMGKRQTHHESYTLPGGENYREILLHTPMPEGQGFPGVPQHFGGAPNVIASIRVKDRIILPGEMGYTLRNKKSGFKGQHYKTPEEAQAAIQGYPEHLRPMLDVVPNQGPSKKMLHIEEIQSDWHQQGREHGYLPKDFDKKLNELRQWKNRLHKQPTFGMDKHEYAEHQDAIEKAEEEYDKMLDQKMAGVPYGPHAKDWHELALKAMIQHAAENGYDQIAVTPGAEQAKRYSMARHVSDIHYDPRYKQLIATGRRGEAINKIAEPHELPSYVGKDVAEKLLQTPLNQGRHTLSGLDIESGGEGMKGFYDKMVPSFLNKFGKKHGVQVKPGGIQTDEDEMVPDNAGLGMIRSGNKKVAPVHTFDITPAMREDVVKNGIPRYEDGGSVDDDYRGSHQAPGPHFGAPMHDVSGNGMYPQDFYSAKGLHYYADASDPTDRDAYSKVARVKGKPNAMVSIHRAIPTSVYNEAMKQEAPLKHMIRKGDWVAINKQYAKDHGDSVLRGDYKVASMRVPASHVWTNADSIHEWGYHPKEEKAENGIIHKAEGGSMNIPSLEQMKALLMAQKPQYTGLMQLQSVGANEAPSLSVKAYLPPHSQNDMTGMPVGGVDIDPMQPGSQFMQPPPQPQQGGQPQDGQPQAGGAPPQGQPAPDNGSNILQMTPQGQAMAAMRPTPQPQAMADGGGVSGSGGLQVNIPLTVGSGGSGGGQLGGLGGLGDMGKNGQPPKPSTLGDMMGGSEASPLLPQPLAGQADTQSNPQDMLQQMMKAFKNAQQSTQAPDVNQTTGNNKLEGITGMATGGGVQGYASKGYVRHEPLKPHPEVGTRFKATPQGNLAQRQKFNIEDYEGKGSIVPIPYDATTRDNLVNEVSGHTLQKGLLTEGGNDYSLDPTHMAQNIGGASNLGIAGRVQKRVDQAAKENEGDVLLMPNTMSEDAENFSHHPTTIVLDLMQQRKLNKKTLKALSDDLRQQYEINPKTRAKEYPYKKFVGYDHPELGNQIRYGGRGLETTAGNLRKKMMERLGQVNIQKLLDYNLGDLKAAILDPDLATDPKAYMGHTVVKAQAGAPLRLSKHSAYDTDYTGTNIGGMGNRPLEIVMPDVYSEIDAELLQRPKKVEKTTAQKRAQVVGALEKRKERFAQPINARVINNAGLYEEGLKNGEFDPKNVESVLAYFKRKGGFKKGGKVKLHSDQDTMMLELSRKKKAK
jgi:hypothetical protein